MKIKPIYIIIALAGLFLIFKPSLQDVSSGGAGLQNGWIYNRYWDICDQWFEDNHEKCLDDLHYYSTQLNPPLHYVECKPCPTYKLDKCGNTVYVLLGAYSGYESEVNQYHDDMECLDCDELKTNALTSIATWANSPTSSTKTNALNAIILWSKCFG